MTKTGTDLRNDPSTYGQKWIDIHALSISVKKKQDLEPTYRAICVIIDSIGCQKCLNHAQKYLRENEIGPYLKKVDDQGRWIGLFDYFYEFHNAVNLRLGKPYLGYETALEMYTDQTDTCSEVCGV